MRARIYHYPSHIRRTTTAIWVSLLALNLTEYLLEWARAIYALFYTPLNLPYVAFLEPSQNVAQRLLIAHLGLFVALIAARALAFLTPGFAVTDHALVTQTWLGRRWVPYDSLRGVRSVELTPSGRFVVWVNSTRGLPLQGYLASLLFGRWLGRGFMLTSDLDGFDQIVAEIVSQLKWKHGAEAFASRFTEEQPTWLLAMISAPRETIRQVATADTLSIGIDDAVWQMASVAASMALPILVSAFIHLQLPWRGLIVLIAAVAELPLASLYLSAVPLWTSRRIEFEDALRVYPLTQLTRWPIAIGLTLLVIAGTPVVLLTFVVVLGILPGCINVVWLTQDWFDVKFPEALLGALLTVIYQVLLYELLIVMLPR